MNTETLKNRRILIAGLGLTGFSVIRFLVRHDLLFDVVVDCDEAQANAYRQDIEPLITAKQNPILHTELSMDVAARYDLVIISPGIPRSHPAIVSALAAGIEVIGDIELFASAATLPVIAVTGSNGKSTVVAWLAHTLQIAGIKALACGNIGQPALDSLLVEADLYVLELSSYQLESTYSLNAISATVLNISADHLDRYESLDHYAQTKRRLHPMSDLVVVNRDDNRTWPTEGLSDEDSRNKYEYFTISLDSADHQNTRWHRLANGDVNYLCDGDCSLIDEAQLSMPGVHNVANALAVLALVSPLKLEFERLRSGLISFAGLPHRSQLVAESDGIRWYNDSKGTNVDACKKAILAMPGPVLLIAGGISKGADFRPLNDVMRCHVKLVILIGRDRELMAEQLDDAIEIVMTAGLDEAVEIASDRAEPGEVVLLSPACASFDMFRNFEDRGDQFVAAVHEVLAA
ncbi:MAG: UDP-N-acetylmuramoyl-L-alanine--D-glutamate ligase [Granulosicoccus sp.]|nr:UDP-N-acetylmuramoyl-L-alanine--D-glutamate ligase [Granulosicoccus sp.]